MTLQLESYTPELGITMIKYSRNVIETFLKNKKQLPPLNNSSIFKSKSGIFCTLKINGNLRGCIGYPYPTHPLGEALVKASIQSAIHDPRFPPIKLSDLEKIMIELTVLTPPAILHVTNPDQYLEIIEIGRDGLIVEYDSSKGLLLPQVPVEQNWSIKEFLEHSCMKAGLSPDMWTDLKVKIYSFQGKIFKE